MRDREESLSTSPAIHELTLPRKKSQFPPTPTLKSGSCRLRVTSPSVQQKRSLVRLAGEQKKGSPTSFLLIIPTTHSHYPLFRDPKSDVTLPHSMEILQKLSRVSQRALRSPLRNELQASWKPAASIPENSMRTMVGTCHWGLEQHDAETTRNTLRGLLETGCEDPSDLKKRPSGTEDQGREEG